MIDSYCPYSCIAMIDSYCPYSCIAMIDSYCPYSCIACDYFLKDVQNFINMDKVKYKFVNLNLSSFSGMA